MPDQKRIQTNIASRERAEGLLEFADDFVDTVVSRFGDVKTDEKHFWKVVAEYAVERCDCVLVGKEEDTPLTEEEAICFEKQTVPYGAYKGQCVVEIDMDYFTEVMRGSFSKMVHRYMRSDRFKQKLSKYIVGIVGSEIE